MNLLNSKGLLGVVLLIQQCACFSQTLSSVTSAAPDESTTATHMVVSTESDKQMTTPGPGPRPPQTTAPPLLQRLMEESSLMVLVCCGLIVACTLLLISTIALLCKVCRLRRRLKLTDGDGDPVSCAEYRVGKNGPGTDSKETAVLMTEMSQTNQEGSNGTAVEDGGMEDREEREVGDPPNSEEASNPAADGGNPSPSNPEQEEPPPAAVASSPEGPEESKDVE
ncbi:uncharacterized protein ACNS7B_016256 [Menidia menidia]